MIILMVLPPISKRIGSVTRPQCLEKSHLYLLAPNKVGLGTDAQ